MTLEQSINSNTLQQWVAEHLEMSQVKERLRAMGYDDATSQRYVSEFKKLKYGKRQTTVFLLTALGAFICFISCVITMINPIPSMVNLFLYGLTSIGIIVIIAGLYFVFE